MRGNRYMYYLHWERKNEVVKLLEFVKENDILLGQKSMNIRFLLPTSHR
jgi:hypothetical protein